jgi:hypothetical protein
VATLTHKASSDSILPLLATSWHLKRAWYIVPLPPPGLPDNENNVYRDYARFTTGSCVIARKFSCSHISLSIHILVMFAFNVFLTF